MANGTGNSTVLGDATSIDTSDDATIDLTVAHATNIGAKLADGYTVTDTISAISGAGGTEVSGADSYAVADTAANITSELANGTGNSTVLGDATSIDTSDDATIDLTVAHASNIAANVADGYDVADTAANITSELANGTGSSTCLLYTSPSPRDATLSRMPSSA